MQQVLRHHLRKRHRSAALFTRLDHRWGPLGVHVPRVADVGQGLEDVGCHWEDGEVVADPIQLGWKKMTSQPHFRLG